MITEDYISFETAKLLKEKGFDEATRCYYSNNGTRWLNDFLIQHNSQGGIACPTLQMAMKWLREEKEIYITIIYGDYPSLNRVFWTPQIDSLEGIDLPDSFYKEYNKYEQACENAIQYCLKNLITEN